MHIFSLPKKTVKLKLYEMIYFIPQIRIVVKQILFYFENGIEAAERIGFG